jgi:hypothetical protein
MDRAGMNQSAVIVRTGISQASMSQCQTGRRKPDLDSFAKLCAALPELVAWFASSVYQRTEGRETTRAAAYNRLRSNQRLDGATTGSPNATTTLNHRLHHERAAPNLAAKAATTSAASRVAESNCQSYLSNVTSGQARGSPKREH